MAQAMTFDALAPLVSLLLRVSYLRASKSLSVRSCTFLHKPGKVES